MMENAFKIIPKSIQKFYVADSAYANEVYLKLCGDHFSRIMTIKSLGLKLI